MDKQKIDSTVDKIAKQTKETLNMMADKIDHASECAAERGEALKNKVKAGTLKATDSIEKTVMKAADKVRKNVKIDPKKGTTTVNNAKPAPAKPAKVTTAAKPATAAKK